MLPSLYRLDQNWQAKYKGQCQLNSMGGEESIKHKQEVAVCQGFLPSIVQQWLMCSSGGHFTHEVIL